MKFSDFGSSFIASTTSFILVYSVTEPGRETLLILFILKKIKFVIPRFDIAFDVSDGISSSFTYRSGACFREAITAPFAADNAADTLLLECFLISAVM